MIGIGAALAGVVVPAIGSVREVANRTACASNLRQIGTGLQYYRMCHGDSLPIRPSGLDQTNPHVLKYVSLQDSVAKPLLSAVGSKDLFYCPGNFQNRTAREWWPYFSGTIAVTYQFPFFLKNTLWQVTPFDYKRSDPDAVLAADYLGSDTLVYAPRAWNHQLSSDGSPKGMNMLFCDGRVEWRDHQAGWVLWGRSLGPINWYLAR